LYSAYRIIFFQNDHPLLYLGYRTFILLNFVIF
jgi:hypothetical protein